MKINKLFNIGKLSILALSFALLTSCFDNDEDFGLDTDKVVATVFDFTGPSLVSLDEVAEFSVTPRPGSTFSWSVNNGELQPIANTNTKVNVLFNIGGTSTVSVFETTASGAVSEVASQDVTVLELCTWSIVGLDSWGDGWNGASVVISFVGGVDIPDFIFDGPAAASALVTFGAPVGFEINVTFNSGAWDSEIDYAVFNNADGSGAPVFFDLAAPTVGTVYTGTVDCP
jgi:hypothetical protein